MSGRLVRGRYLTLVTREIARHLETLAPDTRAQTSRLHAAEAADRLALHLARVIERGIASIGEDDRVAAGVALGAALIAQVARGTVASLIDAQPAEPASVLTAILGALPDGRSEEIAEPLIPLLDTALMTNAPGEPRVGQQILTELPSADRIDLIMAFIRHSGIAPLIPALRRHCEAGRSVRVLTTTYTGTTEGRALIALRDLGAEVRVSYDESTTRLHAKAWLFHRESGFSTAYVGSSNLTHSAQVSGLEWNVRFSEARNPHVLEKVAAVFDSTWHSGDFVPFDEAQFEAVLRQSRRQDATVMLSPIELRPEPFQERLLECIALSRRQGHHRNLLVSATGTGKTVMAAVDYARLRGALPRARLLFVAHRKEILMQSLATFRHALRDAAFGEIWVDGVRPAGFDHVFASIQSVSRSGVLNIPPGHFDVVIVDEFHHAEAPTYRALLEHLGPRELLGLTATPERADGLNLLHWFDDRIAAELRLWDAIDQHRLVPFTYYGIADHLDYRQVPWQRGRGYNVESLSNLITGDHVWARSVIKAIAEKADDLSRMRALGFCVSVDHARFMARVFNEAGIRSVAIWADTPADERAQALRDLADRAVSVVFSVDIFNEGVDVPTVDTLLMLRPTDSPTLFLQQLGRGLRRHHDKATCTVIDFVGLHRREFRFDHRLRALLGGTRRKLAEQVEAGFPFLPAGCHMEFDRVAQERVLASIRSAIPDRWPQKIDELRAMAAAGEAVELGNYLDATGLELEDLYANGKCWTDLLEDAGLLARRAGPQETAVRKAIGRMLHVDDEQRLEAYVRLLESDRAPGVASLPVREQRLLRMLVSSLCGQLCAADASVDEASALLWRHASVLQELVQMFRLLHARVSHVGHALAARPDVPLTVHASYSRIEIQAAFGDGDRVRAPAWREGVRWMAAERSDVFVVTLDKTGKGFSPTTRYRDYAISRELIHWESQSQTRASSATGIRYQRHEAQGSMVMLFARLSAEDRGFYFLGPAKYVSHRSEMPMQVTWRLAHLLPGDLFGRFAAAVA
jgi:superfamily II DNA or RNA helicase/HKD family nuclease